MDLKNSITEILSTDSLQLYFNFEKLPPRVLMRCVDNWLRDVYDFNECWICDHGIFLNEACAECDAVHTEWIKSQG